MTTSALKLKCLAVSLLTMLATQAVGQAGAKNVHGLAMATEPKYGPDFNFEWIQKDAPKGGKLVLGSSGTYDSLNPFAVKNNTDGLIDSMVRLNIVFERLAFDSLGEPFAHYGLLAKTMSVASDGLSITFHLNPKAKFSDGKPVTTADVAFSYKLLTSDKAPPFLKFYYADVKDFVVLSPLDIRFNFKILNRELPLILAELPVLPQHVYSTKKNFVKDYVKVKPVGSGPYTVKSFDFGKQITYERNKNWWGWAEPFAKGKWNFDEIQVKYYKDESAKIEAFKSGDFDYRVENSARAWAIDHAGEKWDLGWISKQSWTHNRNEGSQGFAFNQRRPLFKDRNVRKALAMAFDFDWANDTLFFKQYTQSSSYFNNSEFNAKGLPDAAELALLNPLKDKLPPEIFTEPKDIIGKGLSGKQRLGEAIKLFKLAGWEVKNGKLVDSKGTQFTFTILLTTASMQRLVDPYVQSLAKIGISAAVKMEDSANYIKRLETHDFDVVVDRVGQSESPGNEQRDYWHSSTANLSESRNVGGIADSAIDALVDAVIKASTREALVTATRALDRALWFHYPQAPHYYLGADRVSWWNRIGIPKIHPSHGDPGFLFISYGWYDQPQAEALRKAMTTKSKLDLK